MGKRRKAIACDFDGTLCDTSESYPYYRGEPNWYLINKLKQAQSEGTGIILWTCREGEELDIAVIASKSWGLVFDAVNDNLPEFKRMWGNNPRKIFADEYWDDRAFHIDFSSRRKVVDTNEGND